MPQVRDDTLCVGPAAVAAEDRDRLLSRVFRRNPEPFRGRDSDYRVVRGDIAWEDLLTSHISVNFDRTGLQEDWNVAFPLDRMRELAAEGVIGALAGTHYSFVGAADPLGMEPHACELAGRLKQEEVDSVLLTPV